MYWFLVNNERTEPYSKPLSSQTLANVFQFKNESDSIFYQEHTLGDI